MKRLTLLAATVAMIGGPAAAQGWGSPYSTPQYGTGSNPGAHSTQDYTRGSGTYVQPHMQTNPNSTQMDNYNTRGNVNPYNGAMGTRTPRY